MQPIDPPIGGGRVRLLGLYHNLGLPTHYIGSFDWPGEQYREIQLSSTLQETDIPLSGRHFQAAAKIQKQVKGKTVIDSTFAGHAKLSPEYVDAAVGAARDADIVVFSHPWVYPVVREHLDRNHQLIVYDAQNVEGKLRFALLDDWGGPGTQIVRRVVAQEASLVRSAHLILACSHEDALLFERLYDCPFDKIRIVPNGAFSRQEGHEVGMQRRSLESGSKPWTRPACLFIGSDYEPNLDAARYIVRELAPRIPDMTFLFAGGVGDRLGSDPDSGLFPDNVRILGLFSPEEKRALLAAADIAVNPVESGSGSNVKMFEYLAAGLPVVTTPAGARGIEPGGEPAFRECTRADMVRNLLALRDSENVRSNLSENGRQLVRDKYSWEALSLKLGRLFRRHRETLALRMPRFSVIVPTYERYQNLMRLMKRLEDQSFPEFEVIIVDQSRKASEDEIAAFEIDTLYVHESIRGAVRARNTAAFYARGSILAFIDDDCLPASDWLEKAAAYFTDPEVVGLEGLVRTDKIDDPEFRSVGNENFRGIGFMTANLFLRLGVFNAINGFDERFDKPHFREDSDLGWRALDMGKIPFGFDVQVTHPPHPRSDERESHEERNRFFEKDALLLKKHPQRFKQLFLAEPANKTPEYWEHFQRGCQKYGVTVPEFYSAYMKKTLGAQHEHLFKG